MADKKSFTLMELVIVVIVIGVLAGLALPRFQTAMERVRSSEGVHTLTVLLAAQKRYAMENGGAYKLGSGASNHLAPGDLDVDIPPSNYFDVPYIYSSPAITVRVVRQDGSAILYTLDMNENGNITCTNGSGYSFCSKMGY